MSSRQTFALLITLHRLIRIILTTTVFLIIFQNAIRSAYRFHESLFPRIEVEFYCTEKGVCSTALM